MMTMTMMIIDDHDDDDDADDDGDDDDGDDDDDDLGHSRSKGSRVSGGAKHSSFATELKLIGPEQKGAYEAKDLRKYSKMKGPTILLHLQIMIQVLLWNAVCQDTKSK